jgi:diguanylate cyclase (GGDEF)-like protein/PAS domain S-box-containing protein
MSMMKEIEVMNTRIILDNLFAYVALLDVNGVVQEVNNAPLIRGGYKRDDVIGQFFKDAPWWSYDSAVRSRVNEAIHAANQGKTIRYDVLVKMGVDLVPIDFQISPIFDHRGNIIGSLPTAVDITDRKRIEEKLALSEEQYRFVLEGSELGFWDWNIATNTVERNERWAVMLGYSNQEIQDTTQQWTDFIYPDDREKAWRSITDVLEGRSEIHKLEYRMLHKDGSIRWILDQAKIMKTSLEGRPQRMCGTHTDITERKKLELELEKNAKTDFLTGLFNRRHFMGLANQELHRAIRFSNPMSILMVDLDNFKRINDTHGHKSGDNVLKKFSDVCRLAFREIDIIGRIGGEEFAILLPETSRDQAIEAAERLRTRIATTNISTDQDLAIEFTVSTGVASLSSEDDTLDVLLSHADNALYKAKNTGRNQVRFYEDSF